MPGRPRTRVKNLASALGRGFVCLAALVAGGTGVLGQVSDGIGHDGRERVVLPVMRVTRPRGMSRS